MEEKFAPTGARIREERARLGLSQSAFGEIAGATKWTVINWEKGESCPNSANLEALSNKGADILYIVTGGRLAALSYPLPADGTRAFTVSEPAVTDRERALLDVFRKLGEVDRGVAEQLFAALLKAAAAR